MPWFCFLFFSFFSLPFLDAGTEIQNLSTHPSANRTMYLYKCNRSFCFLIDTTVVWLCHFLFFHFSLSLFYRVFMSLGNGRKYVYFFESCFSFWLTCIQEGEIERDASRGVLFSDYSLLWKERGIVEWQSSICVWECKEYSRGTPTQPEEWGK